MNKEIIGNFIAECRNKKELTQAELSERIKVSNSTISKWEKGKSLPEVSIMPRLCQELDITVNELISGERINDRDYIEKAEANLLNLKKLEESNNQILQKLKIIIQVICIIAFIVMTLIGLIAKAELLYKEILIISGIIVLITGIYFSIKIDKEIGKKVNNTKN